MKLYEQTHLCFKVAINWDFDSKTWPEVELCRRYLGDNNTTQKLQERPWFTLPRGEIWIRKDCVDSIPATFFALQQKINVL